MLEKLTKREFEVVKLVESGLSNLKISKALFVTINTVKTHLYNAFEKLDVHDRFQAGKKYQEETIEKAVTNYVKTKATMTHCLQNHFKQLCNRCPKYTGCTTYSRHFEAWIELQKYKKDGNMVKVVHCKREAFDILIDRTTKWGNPFIIDRDGTREEVISKYEAYIMNRPDLIRDLEELQDKVLGCWCKPEACHGDILVIMVEDELWLK